MRILLTLDFPPELGGIQRYLYNTVKYTYDVSDCVFVGCSARYDVLLTDLPCRVQYFSNRFSKYNKKISLLNLFFALLKNVIKYKSQLIVEAGNVYAAIPVFLISLIWPVKYRVYCYGKEILSLKKRNPRSVLFSFILKKAENVGYITRHTASLLSSLKIESKLTCLPPRIEKTQLVCITGKSLHEPLQLLSTGRLEDNKGHDFLIDVVSALPENMEWRLTIAGSGPQYQFLKKKIENYSMEEKIILPGAIDDPELEILYNSADIFLFPSRETKNSTEGFGIVLIEAMAHGIAIVASQVGGIAEVMDNGTCGILVPSDDIQAWVNGIKRLTYDQDLRNKLIENARLRVEKYYVW